MSGASRSLLACLKQPPIVVAPGVFDALTASIAADAGFKVVYLSGAGIAYTKLGRPDIGLVSMTEVADTLTHIRERVDLSIVVDADTGYGNALNVERTIRVFERAGATAIQLEDQTNPKRCGHLDGKELISTSEMVGKIHAAVDSRRSAETLVIARTDAVAVEGFDKALERANAYREAGADVLFVEAPKTGNDLERIGAAFGGRIPVMANMVEGGATPVLAADKLQALGFSLVIFPGGIVRALARAAQEFYGNLARDGTSDAFRNRMFDFNGLNDLLGTSTILERGKRYDGGNR